MLICSICERNEDEVKIIKKALLCRKCYDKQYMKENYEKNKEVLKERSRKYRDNNKESVKEAKKRHYENNKEKILEGRKEYYKNNKEEIILKVREYRRNNKEKGIEYRRNNKENRNEKRRDRMKNDNVYKLSCLIRNSIKKPFVENKFTKKSKTEEILGCSFVEFKLYLENKFEDWMSWENHGLYNNSELNYGWDIDHIIPISSAKNEEDVIRLSHYRNLQPLCSKVNRDIKKDNIYY